MHGPDDAPTQWIPPVPADEDPEAGAAWAAWVSGSPGHPGADGRLGPGGPPGSPAPAPGEVAPVTGRHGAPEAGREVPAGFGTAGMDGGRWGGEDETVVLPAHGAAYGELGNGPAQGVAYGEFGSGPAQGTAYGELGSGPVPGLVPGGEDDGAPAPGVHRTGTPARPWALLAGVLAAALLAVGGLVWMIGAAIGTDRPAPVAAPPATRSATPSPTPSPTPTPEDTAPYTPPATSAVPTVTVPPPTPTTTRSFPTPRPTTPRPTQQPGLVEVPDVVGLRVNAARRQLERAGLSANVIGFGGNGGDRQVIAQTPRDGKIPRGSTVVLLAGRTRDR